MTYEEWCIKHIGPILDQWNAGAITLDELTSAVVLTVASKGIGTPDGWGLTEAQTVALEALNSVPEPPEPEAL